MEDIIMLTKDKIIERTSSSSYARGCDLYYNDHVEDMTIKEVDWCDDYIYSAISFVVGSQGRVYHTSIEIDEERGIITDYECTCPAIRKYWGLCKHCVALALAYVDERDANGSLKIAKKSTPGLHDILVGYEKESLLEHVSVGGRETPVRMQPILELDSMMGKLPVSFKVGRDRMYVVKSLNEFFWSISHGKYQNYGKELGFTHSKNMFDENAQQLITVLQKDEFFQRVMNQSHFYDSNKTKIHYISGIQLDQFMEVLSESTSIMVKQEQDKKPTAWTILEKSPHISLELKETDSGAELSYNIPLVYSGDEYFYFFEEPHIYQVEKKNLAMLEPFFSYINKRAENPLFIGPRDLPLFVDELLPLLQRHFPVNCNNFAPSIYALEKPEYEFYLSSPEKDVVFCTLKIKYQAETFTTFATSSQKNTRNYKHELGVSNQIIDFFNAYSAENSAYVVFDDEELIYLLLSEGVHLFSQLGQVFIADELKRLLMKKRVTVQVGVAIKGDLLELRIQSNELSIDELTEILSKYDKKKKYYRLKSGEFLPIDDGTLDALASIQENTKTSLAKAKDGVIQVPAYRALYLDQVLKENRDGMTTIRDKQFKEIIRNMKTVEESDYEVPSNLASILRPYQKIGFRWLKTMCNNHFGCILADDMGLGKTLQIITFLQSEMNAPSYAGNNALIICPASLLYNWESEIKKFSPKLKVEVITGNSSQRKEIITSRRKSRILITSYDLLRRDIDLYKNKHFAYQIIDEAQYIKNHGTQLAKAVKIINSEFKVALTGTPIENKLSELWSIFDYLMPQFLYGYTQFRKEIELPIVQSQSEDVLAKFQKMISPFILRRTKREVLQDLPDKVEEIVSTKMEGEQLRLYQAHTQRLKMVLEKQTEDEFKHGKIEVLAELTKLRQLCCDPTLLYSNYTDDSAKLTLCLQYIKQAVEGGHKILLFSQFTSMLSIIEAKLTEENISHFTLTGSTSKEKRRDLVEAFAVDQTSVFCISLKAGGTGLNLTAADIVIHYDPWWNAAVENQATDRTHRIGQKQTVNVYKLVVEGTIEEKIVKLQEKKQELANQLLTGETISSATFTKEELLEIL